MGTVSDIKDRKSFEAWLNARPEATRQQEAVTLAHRAAMRVLPIYLNWSTRLSLQEGSTSLPVLRASLISGLASNASTPEIRKAATDSADSADSAAARSADSAASFAASFAAASAARSADSAARSAASAADSAASFAAAAAWAEIHRDAEQFVEATGQPLGSLWSDPDTDPYAQEWTDALAHWQASPTDWSFWINWANAIRTGTPQNLDMLTEIAIQENDFWTGTDAEVNGRIEKIWLKHRVEEIIAANPYGWRLEYKQGRGKLVSEPVEALDLSKIIKQLRQSLRDFNARCRDDKSANALGPLLQSSLAPLIKDLKRDITKSKTDALGLYKAIFLAKNELARSIKNNGFPNDSPAARLADGLQMSSNDLCLAAPELVDYQRKCLAIEVQTFKHEQTYAILRMVAGLHADSEGMLRAASMLALQRIIDPEASEAEKQGAWYFAIAMLPRGAKAMQEAGAEAASPKEARNALDRVVSGADKLNKLDKGVDAIQEAIEEGGPWAAEFWSQISSGNFWGLG